MMCYIFVQICYRENQRWTLKRQPNGGHDIVSSSLVKLPNSCNGGDSNLPKSTPFKQLAYLICVLLLFYVHWKLALLNSLG